jgi:hypothetical protein
VNQCIWEVIFMNVVIVTGIAEKNSFKNKKARLIEN